MPRRHLRKVAPLTNGRSHVADCWLANTQCTKQLRWAHDSGGVTPPNWIMRPRKSALDQRSTTRSPEKRIIVIPGSTIGRPVVAMPMKEPRCRPVHGKTTTIKIPVRHDFMEFQWGRIAERRPNLFVESAHVGLAHRLGRVAVQLDCLVIEPEISRQIAFIPALTRLFNTARDRTHCFLLSRSLNSSFCPFQFLQASGFARRPRPCSTSCVMRVARGRYAIGSRRRSRLTGPPAPHALATEVIE